jgi:phosphatidylinositol-3-phosphatase
VVGIGIGTVTTMIDRRTRPPGPPHRPSTPGKQCLTGSDGIADTWLRTWMPLILAGPDYRSGRLVVIITWDEGTSTDNHIPTIVISPTTHGTQSAIHYTHCSTLRTSEEILRLPLLGCAASTPSMRTAFHLVPGGPS